MCAKCKYAADVIGKKKESWAMKGCFKLWQTWCAQNSELIEQDIIGWLYENSHCLRVMALQNLVPQRTEIEKRVDRRTPALLKQFQARANMPFRPQKPVKA